MNKNNFDLCGEPDINCDLLKENGHAILTLCAYFSICANEFSLWFLVREKEVGCNIRLKLCYLG